MTGYLLLSVLFYLRSMDCLHIVWGLLGLPTGPGITMLLSGFFQWIKSINNISLTPKRKIEN